MSERVRFRRQFPFAILGVALAAGCGGDGGSLVAPPEPPAIRGNATLGLQAFEAECATCHSAGDGFDLAFFAFPDSTIVRRAVAHVDTATAHDIVAYIHTVQALPTARDLRIFQPGGRTLEGDLALAQFLFGADRLPSDLTAADLLAIDPRHVPIALEFPLWSSEPTNLDWMPDVPIEPGLLDHAGEFGVAREHIDRYRSTRSLDDLILAVVALRIADRDPGNPDAPCIEEPFDRFRGRDCFETRRWIATLAAQHMLRTGDREPLHPFLHDAWWDVGNAARRSRQTGAEIDRAVENWAQWMYLGWAFEPDRHASVYLSIALTRLGLPRHATFHALRSMVARGPTGRAPFMDVRNVAQFSPGHWTFDAVRFGYEHLIDRLEAGTRFRDQEDLDEARTAVSEAWTIASRRIPSAAERDRLAVLRDRILSLMAGAG